MKHAGKHKYPEWLRPRWEEKKRSTADRVAASIEQLKREKNSITLRSICDNIKAECGLSISPNTIKRNELAYEIYKSHRRTPLVPQLKSAKLDELYKDPGQHKQRLQSKVARLRRQTKDTLIAKVILLEQQVERQEVVENALRDELIGMKLE